MSAMDIIGIGVVLLHIIVIGTIILWFILGKPKTFADFRLRFLRDFFGIRPKPTPRA